MKSDFLLDPDIAYLNHGSFGACPRVVFEAYQHYQRELEREPVDFLQRRFPEKMQATRSRLATFLGCESGDLAFVRNATYGMNVVARSLKLAPGDTVLVSDQEYGAVARMWRLAAEEAGATLTAVRIPLPLTSPDQVVEAFREHLDSSVRVIAISHIASELALLFPIAELARLTRDTGVALAVDGAHAPGQLPLDLPALGADFYVGNCHKWLLSPKSAGFVYASPRWADRVRPPVVSWGTISEGTTALQLENEWAGTTDISATLAVTDAIAFLEKHHWLDEVVPACARRLEDALPTLLEITGQGPDQQPGIHAPQMVALRLPPGNHSNLHADLYHHHRVEVPVFETPDGTFLRISVQAYTTEEDLERLAAALTELLA